MAAILSSRPSPLSGRRDPNADPVVAPLARDIECGERADDPFLQRGDKAADVRAAALEIEHDVGDPLAGAVIGQLPAAPAFVDRKPRVEQVSRLGAGARGIERRMLEQPDQFRRLPAAIAAARASMAATASS